MNIREIVNNLIKKYNTNDPFEVADILKIKIIYTDLGNVRGLYQQYKRNKIIFINNKLPKTDKKIVCAHELGHALLHTKLNTAFTTNHTFFSASKFELQANLFAAELIIRDKELYISNNLCENSDDVSDMYIELFKLKYCS